MQLSEKRLAANRANAQKSRGPVTPTGKRNSSRNSTRHGILAKTVVLGGECPKEFARLLNSLIADFTPCDATEHLLVERMAVYQWKLNRIWAVESASIEHEIRHQADATQTENSSTRAMLALRSIAETSRHSDLLIRYEHRFSRHYHDALEALVRLQQNRNSAALPLPAPHDPTETDERKDL